MLARPSAVPPARPLGAARVALLVTVVLGTLAGVARAEPPGIAKSFAPDSVPLALASTLTITLTNPNDFVVTGAGFTDSYPTDLRNAITDVAATTDCSDDPNDLTARGGDTFVQLVHGTLPANGSCVVVVPIAGAVVGFLTNTLPAGSLTTDNAGANVEVAEATLHVLLPTHPVVAKSFVPDHAPAGRAATLKVTVSNLSFAGDMLGIAFTDTYPAGLINATAPAASSSCGGTVTAAPAGGSLSLSGASIPSGESCVVTAVVLASVEGSYTNTLPAGAVSSQNAGVNTDPASAALSVGKPIPALVPPAIVILALSAVLVGVRVRRSGSRRGRDRSTWGAPASRRPGCAIRRSRLSF